jgi:hypothetical protein
MLAILRSLSPFVYFVPFVFNLSFPKFRIDFRAFPRRRPAYPYRLWAVICGFLDGTNVGPLNEIDRVADLLLASPSGSRDAQTPRRRCFVAVTCLILRHRRLRLRFVPAAAPEGLDLVEPIAKKFGGPSIEHSSRSRG